MPSRFSFLLPKILDFLPIFGYLRNTRKLEALGEPKRQHPLNIISRKKPHAIISNFDYITQKCIAFWQVIEQKKGC
jgi:hypothetical protein